MLKIFDYDIRRAFFRLIPVEKRTQTFLEYMYSAAKGGDTLADEFEDFEKLIKLRMTFNFQIIYMETVLNDFFDSVQNRIFIESKTDVEVDYIFNIIESAPITHIFNIAEGEPEVYIKNQDELFFTIDFIVHVPVDVLTIFNDNAIRRVVDIYRLAGKRYTIETF